MKPFCMQPPYLCEARMPPGDTNVKGTRWVEGDDHFQEILYAEDVTPVYFY